MKNELRTELLKRAIENDFIKIEDRIDGMSFINNNLTVIASTNIEKDGKEWLHVSLSRERRIPLYSDIIKVKKIFIGKDKKAIQVFPEEKNHVNIMPFCLHLWHCLDEDSLPEFSINGLL
jgi:hypothetical protein